jgi:putative flavoprotein involved in K+ transport
VIATTTSRMMIGDLTEYGLPPSPRGPITRAVEDDVIPILDAGLVEMLKSRRIEVVGAVEGFDGADVLLSGAERIQPDAVIACAGYARGLEPLVGHLGVLGPWGRPSVHGAETHPSAPNLHFIGYSNPISGMFREFGIDARRIAKAIGRDRAAVRPVPAPAAAETAAA